MWQMQWNMETHLLEIKQSHHPWRRNLNQPLRHRLHNRHQDPELLQDMTILRHIHERLMPMRGEIRILQKTIRLRKRILPDDIPRQTPEQIQTVDNLASPLDLVQPSDHRIHHRLDSRLELS